MPHPLVLPGRFRGACFDMDGLLLDSEPLWLAAERAFLEGHGSGFTDADREATHGRAIGLSAIEYGPRVGMDPADVQQAITEDMRVRYAQAAPLRGARELVLALHGRMPLAVASNTPGWLVRVAIDGIGLGGVFDAVVSGSDLGRPKPGPEPFLAACEAIGVAPADAVAFEDSPTGVRSAHAAGLFVVGVIDRPDVDLLAEGASVVIASLADVVVTPA